MRKSIAPVVAIVAALATAPASAAANKTMCYQAHGVRAEIVQKYGKKAAGRNICRHGLRGGMKPTSGQKARYLRSLRRLNAPAPYQLIKTAGFPRVKPAGVMSPYYAPQPGSLAACIVHHESGGDPMAQNGQYHGIAQWSSEAWHRHGGGRFASDPHGATYQEQLLVLSDGLRRYGCRDWCPFDPC